MPRVFTSGYGVPPKVRSSTLHMWTLDETAATDSARDLLGTEDLVDQASPGVTAVSPIGGARTLARASSQYFLGASTGTDAAAMTGAAWSLGTWFRINSGYANLGWVVAYAATGESAATNVLGGIYVDASKQVTVFWEHTSGTNVSSTYTTHALEEGRWYHVVAVRTGTTLDLYIDGNLAQTWTGLTAPTTSAGVQRWTIGNSLSDTSQLFDGHIATVHVDTAALTAAEVAEDYRRGMLWDAYSTVVARVDVEDGNGNMVTLNDLNGVDWVDGVDISDSVDANFAEASVRLFRKHGDLSLSLYHDNRMNRTPANHIGPDSGTYTEGSTEVLGPGRDLDVYVLRLPLWLPVPAYSASSWQHIFQGKTRKPNWGPDIITVQAYDDTAELERAYFLDQQVVGTDGGRAIQSCIQDLLDAADTANILPAITLTNKMPTAIAWNVTTGTYPPDSVLAMISKLVEMNGCRCRYLWNDATAAFELTLYEPARTRTLAQWVLNEDDYLAVNELSIDLSPIRTQVKVTYVSSESSTPSPITGSTIFWEAQGQIASVTVESDGTGGLPSTVSKYGTISCEIVLGSTDQIDEAPEADRCARAVLRDLCNPTADKSVDAFCFPELLVGDLGRWEANGSHTTGDLTLANVAVAHSFGAECKTSVQCRGSPSGGSQRHLNKEARGGTAAAPPNSSDDVTTGLPYAVRWGAVWETINNSTLGLSGRHGQIVNPDFSSRLFTPEPDGWEPYSGSTWDTHVGLETSTVETGKYAVKLFSNTTGEIVAKRFTPCPPSPAAFQVEARCNLSGATSTTFTLTIDWYDSSESLLSSSTTTLTKTTTGWAWLRGIVTAPASARYYKMRVKKSNSAVHGYVDRVGVMPLKPAFHSYLSGDQVYNSGAKTWVDIVFDSETYDHGGVHATASGIFTAPESGFYQFDVHARMNFNSTTAYWAWLKLVKDGGSGYDDWVVSTPVQVFDFDGTAAEAHAHLNVATGLVKLASGDAVKAQIWGEIAGVNIKVKNGITTSYFNGGLVAQE